MNQRSIWLIIILMGLALIGSVLLQVYWINGSMELSRKQFDNNVINALNQVSAKLEAEEDNNIKIRSGITLNRPISSGGQNVSVEFSPTQSNDAQRQERNAEIVRNLELEKFRRMTNEIPLEERITQPKKLSRFIRDALANRGIDFNFNYGVFSNQRKGFVIKDGHFLVNDFGSQGIPVGERTLTDSKYKIQLFSNGINPPGYLMVYFPGLTNKVWKSAWRTIFLALLSTGIILYCFVYTVYVIFRQKKVSEMKTDFINNMTHEFKTPIATISLASDSITSPMISGNPDKVNRFAEIIKQENKRMLSQVEKVLQMAQLDKEDFKLKVVEVDMHSIIRTAVENANLQVAQKDGIVNSELKAEKAVIEGDMTHLSNIIHNLLDNANKYSPEKPEILVTTKNVSNGIQITIKDNGIGMNKEALKHIFDKFYRVHTGNRHDVKGFGLGLSYVKAMMTAHKGQIDVKSTLGKGSSFILFFPFYQKV